MMNSMSNQATGEEHSLTPRNLLKEKRETFSMKLFTKKLRKDWNEVGKCFVLFSLFYNFGNVLLSWYYFWEVQSRPTDHTLLQFGRRKIFFQRCCIPGKGPEQGVVANICYSFQIWPIFVPKDVLRFGGSRRNANNSLDSSGFESRAHRCKLFIV